MKKLSIVCALLCVLGLMVTAASTAEYRFDILESGNPGGSTGSLKTFDSELTTTPPQTLAMDVWMTGAPGNATSGGLWINFKTSTDKVSYVSSGRALTNGSEGVTGPWDAAAGGVTNEANGIGTLQIVVGQPAGAAPDGDGDIIVARVTLEYSVPGTASITARTIPGFSTWGPLASGWDDAAIPTTTLDLSPGSTTTSVSTDTTSTSTSSTTTQPGVPPLCMAEELYGKDSMEAETLRSLRDSVLSKTPEGRELITLYYQWSPVMVRYLRSGREAREELKLLIDHILHLLRSEKSL